MSEKSILVTGSNGFLGKSVKKELKNRGYTNVIASKGKKECDFRNRKETQDFFEHHKPNSVIHLAATVGGIGANQANPGMFFYDNISMGINLIDESYRHNVEKFVLIGTVCMYPNHTTVPFKESDLWTGYPEPTNAPYGIAKKALMEMLNAYRKQYGFNGITLLPVNLYGPHDNFHPDNSHVIPALINKVYDAMTISPHKNVIVWGTGNASREFLYADDCAKGILDGLEKYNQAEPLNLGTGQEIKIKDLIDKIANLMGFKGKILFDHDKPDGQMRRCLDITNVRSALNFKATTDFDEGLRETIKWYMAQKR